MKTVDALLQHADFRAAFDAIDAREQRRRFCRHGLDHALDVARITWILTLEHQRPFDRETVYLAALLHDIGRSLADEDHDRASARLAEALLRDCGAEPELREAVTTAIAAHRCKDAAIDPATASLGELLALADTRSRPCYRCPAASDCHWPEARKNHTITF